MAPSYRRPLFQSYPTAQPDGANPYPSVQAGLDAILQRMGGAPSSDGEEDGGAPAWLPVSSVQPKGSAPSPQTGVGSKTPARLNTWDPIIEREVGAYNRMNEADPGDDVWLDPDLVKAMVMTESGYDRKAYNSDPMQVNKSTKDWDGYKGELGLTRGQPPGPELGIRVGLQWLDSKAYKNDSRGNPGPFLGYEHAIKAYNGKGNPRYWDLVQGNYRLIKGEKTQP